MSRYRIASERNIKLKTPWKAGISIVIFWIFSALIPLYNKLVFSGAAGAKGFGFPATTTALQLGLCAILLSIYNILEHKLLHLYRGYKYVESSEAPRENKSWILGSNFWYKTKVIAPIGIGFGLKYCITNWGLHLIPLAPHLLLQATDLMWTVLFARFLNGEQLTFMEGVACAFSTMGTMLVAWRTNIQLVDGWYAISVNLISPIMLGICITTLRSAANTLIVEESHSDGKVPGMGSIELTAIKLWISTLVVIPVAFLFENGGMTMLGYPTLGTNETAYSVVTTSGWGLPLAALAGGLLVLVFQVNVTYLSSLVTAVTVGIVGGMKIFPQWLVAWIVAERSDYDPLNILGAVVLLVSSLVWTRLRMVREKDELLRIDSTTSSSSSTNELLMDSIYPKYGT